MVKMWRWMLVILMLTMTGAFIPSDIVQAAPAEQNCRSERSDYDPGKTPTGFEATATDGCNTFTWTSNTFDMAGSGTVKFKTVGNMYGWEPGNTLPSVAGGPQNFCRAMAAQDANLIFTNYFKAPVGTEVTVTYRCW